VVQDGPDRCRGVFLVYVGWVNWRSAAGRPQSEPGVERKSVRQQVAFALAVSLLNPHAILDTIGVIGTSALAYTGDERLPLRWPASSFRAVVYGSLSGWKAVRECP